MHDPINNQLRSSLDEQIEAFLTKGGEITEVAIGTSGISADHKKAHWSKSQAKKADAKAPRAEAVAEADPALPG
ncbi:MAG TPA: hypothetical protein VLF16_06750 [Pseudomonas sp.]|nr:hypothetical protein [Pseudomonas sp.]